MQKFRNQKGQSLIQVLVSLAILGVIMLTFATMTVSQQREISALGQKFAEMDLQNLLSKTLADGSVCKYLMNNPVALTFNSTAVSPQTPQVVTPTLPIYASVSTTTPLVLGPVVAQVGAQASPDSNTAFVNSITLSITGKPSPPPPNGPGATFTGTWLVSFDPSRLVRPMQPIAVSTILTVDTTNPSAATITSCSPAAPSAGFSSCRVLSTSGMYTTAISCAPTETMTGGGGNVYTLQNYLGAAGEMPNYGSGTSTVGMGITATGGNWTGGWASQAWVICCK